MTGEPLSSCEDRYKWGEGRKERVTDGDTNSGREAVGAGKGGCISPQE